MGGQPATAPRGPDEEVLMSEATLGADDNVGSSHDADVDAAYDDENPASEAAGSSPDALDGDENTSHAADVDAGFKD